MEANKNVKFEKTFPQKIMHQQELKKCDTNVAVCGNIFLFGECTKSSCQFRHILNDSDKPFFHLPSKCIVNFELVSVTTPTRFVIKILSHTAGGRLISWADKHRETENFFEENLQNFTGEKAASVKVGGVYSVQNNGKWHRGRVIAIP